MVLNYIWLGFFVVGFLTALIRWAAGDLSVFPAMVDSLHGLAKTSVEIALGLVGVMSLWLGIMKVGELGGAVALLTKVVSPFFRRLFPEIPAGHPAMGSMMMNFAANMLGLDNSATPLGLKAMAQLQELNPEKDRATNAQIMFLVLNAAGLTVIPVSVIALRVAQGAANPTDVFIPILISTFAANLTGLVTVSLFQRINLLQPVVIAYLAAAAALVGGLLAYFKHLDTAWLPERARLLAEQASLKTLGAEMTTAQSARLHEIAGLIPGPMAQQSQFLGSFLILSIILSFLLLAAFRKINVYEAFVEGAKEGFQVAVRIIPYLVAMLVAIGVFRASGAMTYLMEAARFVVSLFGDSRWVDSLPVALMKPLSGSGARGAAVEVMKSFGADSFPGTVACIMQGTTETTFYILAVYYGAVGVVRTRYTVVAGLIADIAGLSTAVAVAYFFFGSR